jgi:hypothetical protein
MVERDPVRLLDALLTVCQVAAVPPAAIAPMLKRLLQQLATENAPDTKTAPPLGENGAEVSASTYGRPRTVTLPARRTPRRASAAKTTRSTRSRANSSGSALSTEWRALRAAIDAEAKRRGLSRTMLAKELKLNAGTVRTTLAPSGKEPGPAFVARLRKWLDTPAPAPAETATAGHVVPPGNNNGAAHDQAPLAVAEATLPATFPG